MNGAQRAVYHAPNQADTRFNKLHGLILLMYWGFLTYPALSTGYIPSRDVLIHLLWSSSFSDQLWAGDLYPRWLSGMNNGFGSPAFIFYGPLPYYFTALLRPFLAADPEGWHQLGVAAALAVLFSGAAAYAWLRAISSEIPALIGALFYMSAPYHLACDLYERFAFAELWAFVWLPLILLSVQRITEERRTAVVSLGLSYAALTLTHLPTTMIFSWIPLLYAVLISERRQWMANAGLTLLGMALGMGMAAVYVIPALLTQQNASFTAMHVGHYFYGYHFLYYGPRFNQEFAKVVESQGRYASLMLLTASVAILLGLLGHEKTLRRQYLLWTVVALAAFAIMLPVSRPIWGALPLLQVIQFPWRFNLLLTLAASATVGLGMQTASARGQGWKTIAILAVCAYATLPTWRANAIYQIVSHTPGRASIDKLEQQFGSLDSHALKKALAAKLRLDVGEYRPHWVPADLFSETSFEQKMAALRKLPQNAQAWWARQIKTPEQIEFTTHAKATTWVPVHQFYYPNWTARIAGHSERLPVRPSAIDGRLEVQVPPGEQQVVVSFENRKEEHIGLTVSLISGVMLLVLAWVLRKQSS